MPNVTWVLPDGSRVTAAMTPHANMMQAAVANNIRTIVGECGGCLSCATCHVHVDPAWIGRVGAAAGSESDMLEVVEAERRPTSRLSCQIKASDALDGLVLHVPAL
jgi:ferredoxin, 2Fe-2S